MNRETKQKRHHAAAEDTDPVEVAGLESFPASDPPSWIPVRAGSPNLQNKECPQRLLPDPVRPKLDPSRNHPD